MFSDAFKLTTCALLLAFVPCASARGDIEELVLAEHLLLRGNYQEGLDAFRKLTERYPVRATLGRSRCLTAQGQPQQACEVLDELLLEHPQSVDLRAAKAALALKRGELSVASGTLQAALELEPDHIPARWLSAELLRIEGKIAEACRAYRWFADYYDRQGNNLKNFRELLQVGQGIAQHARFNRDHRRFHQLTRQIYPRVLRLEPNAWQAHLQTALLLQEKYNNADAQRALSDALKINPHAAEVHVALARLALDNYALEKARRHVDNVLRSDSSHLRALQCQADIAFASLKPSQALTVLEKAKSFHATNQETLGRIAAAHSLLNSPQHPEHKTLQENLIAEVQTLVPHPGQFYAVWGEALERARRYPLAGAQLRQAIQHTPELVGPRGMLGMIEMRLGHEDIARRWLQESFEIDPYNVRVKNQLEVLSLLDEYETLETEHFIVRFDSQKDQRLGTYVAQRIERWHEELSQDFQFHPQEKSVIEFFHDARGQRAREWFGARMVGLPNIHTIAACSGNVVAMVSPTSDRSRRNWADILRHELVHLINVQQTEYNVPHWLTEGCAVWQEGRPRPRRWEKLLLKRFPEGRVYKLDNLNLGFLKPRSHDDWLLAYCQAEIYVEVILQEFGQEGLQKLLRGYRDNLPSEEFFSLTLGVSQQELDRLATEKLEQIVSSLSMRPDIRSKPDLAQARELHEANPGNPENAAKLALARLEHGDYPGAGRLAEKVLSEHPQQALARLVRSRLLLRIGDDRQATLLLEELVKTDPPNPVALMLLAKIRLGSGEYGKAKSLYEQGSKLQTDNVQWIKALAVVALKEKNGEDLGMRLAQVAEAEPENLLARKKCLELAMQRNDVAAVVRWCEEVLHVDPRDEEAYQTYQSLKEN